MDPGDINGGVVNLDKSNILFLLLVGVLILTTFSYGVQYSYADASILLDKNCQEMDNGKQWGKLRWLFNVTNTGDVALENFTLTDLPLNFNNSTLGFSSLNPLNPTDSALFFIDQDKLLNGTYSNNATVTADVVGSSMNVTSNMATDSCEIVIGPPTVPGDIITEIFTEPQPQSGVGMSFNGTHFWIPRGMDSSEIGVWDTDGNLVDTKTLDCTVGNLTWDVGGNNLYGYRILFDTPPMGLFGDDVPATSAPVYSINPDTLQCTMLFDALPVMNATGSCGKEFCHWPSDGIDFDERDGDLWISPDASTIIYKFDLSGNLTDTIGPISTEDVCQIGRPDWSSGIATGEGNLLYSATGPCDFVFAWDKDTGARVDFYEIPATRNEAAACDNVTFADDPFDAIWIKDLDGHLRSFVVPEGTCEIVPSGELKIVKNTIGGDGTFNFTSTSVPGFQLTTVNGMAMTTISDLAPGNKYDVSENIGALPGGFEFTNLECDDLTSQINGTNATVITVDPGQTTTCTFTNTKLGMLQINKIAVGGDGEFSFLSNVTGLNNFNITTTDGTGSSAKVNVTGIFNVTEIVPDGWTLNATATSCDDGSPTDAINVTAGEFVTCTFVNDIIPPPEPGMLQINKIAVGGDGEFSFLSNVTGLNNFNITTTDGTGSSAKVNVTGIFNVTEIVPDGWTLNATATSCDDGSPTDAINVTAGEFVTCTFVNDIIPPPEPGMLQINKIAVGGDGEFSFLSNVTGLNNFNITTTDGTGSSAKVNVTGIFNVTEIVPDGWTLNATATSCDDGSPTDAINVTAGEFVTCTFVNDIIPPPEPGMLQINKIAVGGDGEFSFLSNVTGLNNFNITTTDGTGSSAKVNVTGIFNVTEIVPDGWTLNATATSCDDGSPTDAINVTAGEFVTCTFVNDIIPPPEPGMLQINKIAVGGDGEFSFLSNVTGLNNFNITTTDGTGSSAKVNVTGIFNVTEIVPDGWTLNATATSCDDGSPTDAINVTAGEFVTCTFVNDIIPPPEPGMLQINKIAVGGDGEFSFLSNVTGLNNFNITTTDGTGSSAKVNVTGIFNVTEIVPDGWTLNATATSCDDGSPTDAINVTAGEFVTCTFVNDIIPPPEPGMLQINKIAVGGDGEFSFLSNVTGLNNFNITTTDGTGSSAKVNVTGIFNVTEIVPDGWTLNATATSCDDGSPTDAINVTAGEFVTCTFVNDIIPPPEPGMLQINKIAVGGDGEFSFLSNVTGLNNFNITTTDGTGSSAKVNVTGIFNVTEIVPDGWTLNATATSCDDGSPTDAINVTAGEFVTCTFQNEKLTPLEPTEGFMTGGGFVIVPSTLITDENSTDDKKNNSNIQRDNQLRLNHGFELHCNPEFLPNNLEVNWLGNSFHMAELLSATCLDDSTPNEPPKSPHPGPILDVYVGEGYGRFNGEDGAHAEWMFTDNGEPGKKDEIIKLIITTSSGDVVLSINDTIDLNGGNHQFLPHNTHQHEKKIETTTETSIKNTNGKSEKDSSNVDKANFFSEVSPPSNPGPDSSSIIDIQDSKGGGNEHLTRPTFGLSHETQESLIDGGFTFNDQLFPITDNHHTPFQEQSVIIGEENTFSATLYADKGLKVQEFLFGIPNVGEAHLAELGIEVWYGYNNEINEVKAVQKSNVIDKESIVATHEKTKCASSDIEANCNTTNLSIVFLEPLKDKVMAIKAIDFKNRYQITYLNEGLDISGSSLNPMKTQMIPSDVKGEGLIQVTQIEKYSPYWISEKGRLFEMNSFGSFNQINKSFERFHDSGDARTRLHSGFGGIIAYEQNRATEIFDSEALTKDLQKSFSYSFPEHEERINNLLEKKMLEQENIAEKILERFDIQSRW